MSSPRFPIPEGTLDMLGRDAKFYCVTPAGRKQLAVEKDSWARLTGAVDLIFEEGSR